MIRGCLFALVLLGACTTPLSGPAPPNTAEEATAQDTCGASQWRQYIGRPVGDIDRSRLPPRARVIMPGQMVTMDFSAGRLNIRVGPDGKVTEVGCF
jgi:hypothetical protein